MTVGQRFSKFLDNIGMTEMQLTTGQSNHAGVRRCLNKHYYGSFSETANSFLIGSWARATRVRPPRDIDVMFILPSTIYDKYQLRSGNVQSQLLQEVKSVLTNCYTTTKMSGDGQVVLVSFSTQTVELVPCFYYSGDLYRVCDTNGGGSYKLVNPSAQQDSLSASDSKSNGNTRHLVRMLKKWQDYCSVPLKSFWLELLSEEFISQWQYAGNSTTYYDWMVRDFFAFLLTRANGGLHLPSTYEYISLGDDWKSKTTSAYDRAVRGAVTKLQLRKQITLTLGGSGRTYLERMCR